MVHLRLLVSSGYKGIEPEVSFHLDCTAVAAYVNKRVWEFSPASTGTGIAAKGIGPWQSSWGVSPGAADMIPAVTQKSRKVVTRLRL
jgi:hypothetical protein